MRYNKLIPQMHLGPPAIDARAKGYNWGKSLLRTTDRTVMGYVLIAGLYSTFTDRAALDKYAVSEAHVKVVTENVKPNVEGEPDG
jgi:hypothetical protein